MKRLFYAAIFSISLVIAMPLFHACNENVLSEKDSAPFVFTYTSACGWCAGSKALTVVGNVATFDYHAACNNTSRHIERTLTMAEVEELDLENLFPIIKTMNLDECGVCADGCDEKISFVKTDQESYIRFTSDADVDKLEEYIETLRNLMQLLDQESQEE